MAKELENEYTPDYLSPRGETLEELLEERSMSQAELALRMGRPKKTINEIIHGRTAITPETALQLERVLGAPAEFWNRREQRYRQFLARQQELADLNRWTDWLPKIPVKEMARLNWIELYTDPCKQLLEVLRFYAVASPAQWQEIWQEDLVAFRKSQAFESDQGAVTAWLRQGEIRAYTINCAPYNETAFRQLLQELRALTTETPEVFVPALAERCAAAGVAVVFLPEISRLRVCGVTRWLTPTKALIQLSLRYKTNDQLWFTFFHEAGHIVLHGKRDVFLEPDKTASQISEQESQKETQADKFAADLLIPPEAWQAFIASRTFRSKAGIQSFAESIGIAPGIVVGRLQHEHHIPFKDCNALKETYRWVLAEGSEA